MNLQQRLAVGLLERDGFERDVAGGAFELEGPRDPLGLDDLDVHAVERELVAVGVPIEVSPRPAGARIHRIDDRRIPRRSPPFGDLLGLDVRAKYSIARRIDQTADKELLFAGR